MKIDFDRTEAELSKLVEETVLRLTTEHADAAIKRLGLWGLAFPAVAKVLVDVEDNGQNLGRGPAEYEYVENDIGARMANMRAVINRWPAYKKINPLVLAGFERLLFSCERVVEKKGHQIQYTAFFSR